MSGLVWNIEPTLLKIGPLQLRYYGILFGATLLLGYHLFQKQMLKSGHSKEFSEKMLLWGVLAVVVGARLVHCLFYEPDYYLANPIEILKVWKGGIASHGATLGLFTVVLAFSRIYKIPFLVIGDAVVFAAAVAAIFVRIGNFFNSEIVGRATNVPWAIQFPRYDNLYRHPSQLYEASGGFLILMILLFVDKKMSKRVTGLFSGIFLSMYFTFRFLIEFVKEFQEEHRIGSILTMGQYLSIPFIIVGLIFIVKAVKKLRETTA